MQEIKMISSVGVFDTAGCHQVASGLTFLHLYQSCANGKLLLEPGAS